MPIRVLVVEDSVLISSALRILLESTGYDVSVAGTAAEALEAGANSPPDVLLLDLTLPDADGLTVIGELLSRDVRPSVKLAMTGYDDEDTRERCLAAGCDDVLIKPVPVADLLRVIAERMT
ncbi:MAG TPA: response regulator [Rhodothermia bacterium]|nr:response regulator [Rhodothermia bacterium]